SRMRSAARTNTGGIGTGNGASVSACGVLGNERGPAGWPSLSSTVRCLVALVPDRRAGGALRVRIRNGRSGSRRLPLPRLAVIRGGRVARVARAGAVVRLRRRAWRCCHVDGQSGAVDTQGAAVRVAIGQLRARQLLVCADGG